MMTEIIKQLASLPMSSGDERAILDYIEKRFKHLEITYDGMGSLVVVKRCGQENAKRVMLLANVDEPGLVVNYIEENGYLRVTALGAVNAVSAAYREVVIDGEVRGFVLPEKGTEVKGGDLSHLYVDIGAKSRSEAEAFVRLGDICCFVPTFSELCGRLIGGSGVASRACAALLISALEKDYDRVDLYACFAVQGNLRGRGAKTAAFDIEPDECITVEVCESFDTVGATRRGEAVIGDGAVILAKTSDYIADPALRERLERCATAGGFDFKVCVYPDKTTAASQVSRCGKGVPCVSVTIPVRNAGSGAQVLSALDAENVLGLCVEYIMGD